MRLSWNTRLLVGLPNNADDATQDANIGSDDETLVNSDRDPTFGGSNSSQRTLVPSPAEGASHADVAETARIPIHNESPLGGSRVSLIIGGESSRDVPTVFFAADQTLATSGSMNEEADYTKGNSGNTDVASESDATISAVVNEHSSPVPAVGTSPNTPVSGDDIIDAKSEETNHTNATSDNVVHSAIANDAAGLAMPNDRVGLASAAVPSSNASVIDDCAFEGSEESSELIEEEFGESP